MLEVEVSGTTHTVFDLHGTVVSDELLSTIEDEFWVITGRHPRVSGPRHAIRLQLEGRLDKQDRKHLQQFIEKEAAHHADEE